MADLVEASIVVDGANWAWSLSKQDARVNFEKLVDRVQEAANLKITALTFWTAYRSQEDLGRRWPFLSYLKDLGWNVNIIPATLVAQGHWADKQVDINIALDAYEDALAGFGAVIIGSGDGDFAAVFKRFPKGVQGYTLAFRNNISSSLAKVSHVIYMEDLRVLFKEGRMPSMGSASFDQGWDC